MNTTRAIMARSYVPGLLALAAAGAGLAGLGCGGPVRRDEPFTAPLTLTDPGVARGQIVYARHCHECHPGGAGGLGPSLNDKPLPVFGIKTQVRAGAGEMPAFDKGRISDEDLEALVRYLKGLRNLQ